MVRYPNPKPQTSYSIPQTPNPSPKIETQMTSVKKYLSLVKFSHTIFAMPFAIIGFMLGWQVVSGPFSVIPGWHIEVIPPQHPYFDQAQVPNNLTELLIRLALVVLCMVFARSAAMAFNRYLDRQFDKKNPRTAIREIPAGILKADHVLWFTIINSLLFMSCI